MGILQDLDSTIRSYVADNVNLDVVDVTKPGTSINVEEVCGFQARVSNRGLLKMTDVSRTVDEHQLVDELVISFTHTTPIDWMLPGVAPTGKKVEVAFAVIVGVKDGKVSHEHIYWDQATVLVQLGLLDPKGLPVVGAESARRVLDPKLPPRRP